MKSFFISTAILFSAFSLSAQTQTATIKVYGECGMCRSRIEKTAKATGATKASWEEDNKELTVTFDARKTSAAKIEKALAGKGHDTEHETATKAAYDKLPECCHYERKKA
jgi:mercuric ion binding protein